MSAATIEPATSSLALFDTIAEMGHEPGDTLFGLYHGSVWRFLPTALLGFALSCIALAADSIVPAMIAHFANNACIIALVSLLGADSSASTSVQLRLVLIAIGAVGVTTGGLLLARAHRSRKPAIQQANDAADQGL